ncbi:MAG TPA: TrmH family RNA methyltransferase, partial [Burkholderiaceae bacterium]|nr:TrmH family RNA methyltransferase [Burkholderiaceae bacterium]
MTATPARDALALLPRVRIVLVEPSHPGNIGAAARAMKVMGLRELVLVSPRWPDAPSQPEAIAFASGATDVLSAVRISSSFTDAIGDATLAVAVSARGREYGPPPQPPERIAELALDELAAHPQHRVAFVFGSERIGLSIEQAGRCQRLLSIPTDADYDSLNLAQAVQIVAYCLRRAALQ